jgi:hypothetical protein
VKLSIKLPSFDVEVDDDNNVVNVIGISTEKEGDKKEATPAAAAAAVGTARRRLPVPAG